MPPLAPKERRTTWGLLHPVCGTVFDFHQGKADMFPRHLSSEGRVAPATPSVPEISTFFFFFEISTFLKVLLSASCSQASCMNGSLHSHEVATPTTPQNHRTSAQPDKALESAKGQRGMEGTRYLQLLFMWDNIQRWTSSSQHVRSSLQRHQW